MNIDYGERHRFGVLLPSGNSIAEPEIRAMLPAGVCAHVTRLKLTGSSESELLGMIERLEDAALLLADARPAEIAFHCTAASVYAPHLAGAIAARITAATGLPAFATADAFLAALHTLGAQKVSLITPYIAPVHEKEMIFLAAHGFAVTGDNGLGLNTNAEMARLAPADIITQAIRHTDAQAEACFISCTAIRSACVITALEDRLGIPVITSNQAMVWHALRRAGLPDTVAGFGRLFAHSGRL